MKRKQVLEEGAEQLPLFVGFDFGRIYPLFDLSEWVPCAGAPRPPMAYGDMAPKHFPCPSCRQVVRVSGADYHQPQRDSPGWDLRLASHWRKVRERVSA